MDVDLIDYFLEKWVHSSATCRLSGIGHLSEKIEPFERTHGIDSDIPKSHSRHDEKDGHNDQEFFSPAAVGIHHRKEEILVSIVVRFCKEGSWMWSTFEGFVVEEGVKRPLPT